MVTPAPTPVRRRPPAAASAGLLLRRDQLDVEAQRLQLADEHVERLGQPRRERRVALDDRLVDLGAAGDVVRLRREQLLEDVRRAVGLERPHLHFAEALAAELRLAAQRLLRDERVRPDRARVDLVVDQVRQLQHVDVADGHVLLERARRSCRRRAASCRPSAGPACSSQFLISVSVAPSNTGVAK